MFRIIKVNGKWLLITADRKHLFVQFEEEAGSKDEWRFVLFIENIRYENDTLSFLKEPKEFASQQEGFDFIDKILAPVFFGEKYES